MDKPVDAVQRILVKAARDLEEYPELHEHNPERQQDLEAWLATLEQGDTSMAYKPTGNPVGRPKTKEYVTLLARVPADLGELVKKYAGEHRISIATVLREGAAWRIGDGDPRGNGMYLEESTDTREKTYYANTETVSSLDSGTLLADMQTSLTRQEAQIQALTQMLEQQAELLRSNVYSSNTPIPANEVAASYQEAQHAQLAPLAEEQVPGSAIPTTMPPYDTARHHLGPLCPSKDEWGTTGQSLKNADNQCLACKARAKREKAARKRAEREAATA